MHACHLQIEELQTLGVDFIDQLKQAFLARMAECVSSASESRTDGKFAHTSALLFTGPVSWPDSLITCT